MLYVQLYANWPENPKRIKAGLEASAIHAIALCLAKRSDKDGWIDRVTLALFGGTDELIDRLLEVGLLDSDGELVRPHDWLEVNLSSDRIRQERTDKSRAANHARWHFGTYEECSKCHPPEAATPTEPGTPTGLPPDSEWIAEKRSEDEEKQQQATDADGRRAVLEAAAAIIGERAGERPTAQNPAAVAAAVARGVIADRYQDAYRHLAENPAITPAELAELLEPTTPKEHPLDSQAAAARAMAERNRKRLAGEACWMCDGAGFFLNAANAAIRCECMKESA